MPTKFQKTCEDMEFLILVLKKWLTNNFNGLQTKKHQTIFKKKKKWKHGNKIVNKIGNQSFT